MSKKAPDPCQPAHPKTPFSSAELRLLLECVSACFPQLVRDVDSFHMFCCPRCQTPLDPEYAAFCSACGQSLSWYGSVKHARRLEEGGKEPQSAMVPEFLQQSFTLRQKGKLADETVNKRHQVNWEKQESLGMLAAAIACASAE